MCWKMFEQKTQLHEDLHKEELSGYGAAVIHGNQEKSERLEIWVEETVVGWAVLRGTWVEEKWGGLSDK